MGEKKLNKRSKIKPFIKVMNFSHLMPTRHTVDLDLKKIVGEDALTQDKRPDTKKAIKVAFEEKFKNPLASTSGKASDKKVMGAQSLFTKLRF